MFIRKRLTYANVAATLALVFAMSGGAFAASHYIITSTKQISPKVIKHLKGKRGKRGKRGKPGPIGQTGATGPQGKEGLAGKEGPPGKEGKEGPPGKNGAGTPLFFKAEPGTGPTTIAMLDGAEIVAECSTGPITHLVLHATAAHGIYHGQYDVSGTATEVYADNLEVGAELDMLGGGSDYEGWFSYVGPSGHITTGIFGDDTGGSHSGDCLIWGNTETSSTGTTGGA